MTDTTSAAPVAWRVHPFDYGIGHEGVYAMTQLEQQRDAWLRKGWKVEPLYVAPRAAMEPLTDGQISRIARSVLEAPAADGVAPAWTLAVGIARAIEAAHGIGIKKGSLHD